MTLPNFLIIGVAKAATSSLYAYLEQHPHVFMSANKEPHFFAFEDQEVNFCGPGDAKAMSNKVVTKLEDYEALFSEVSIETAIGEASTNYLYYSYAAERIKKYLPGVKLIVVLRNPVERAYSAFLHRRRDGRETCSSFEKALSLEKDRIEGNWSPLAHYRGGGFYYEKLKHYFDLFDRQQIQIFLYDDVQEDLLNVIHHSYTFLEVDNSFIPDVDRHYNVSILPRNPMMAVALNFAKLMKTVKPIDNFMSDNTKQAIKSKMTKKPESMSHTIRARLTEDYRLDIIKLQELIDRDLTNWLL